MALRATCRTCLQGVPIEPRTVLLTIDDDGRGRYVFECSFCGALAWRELSASSLSAMASEGVTVTSVRPTSKSDGLPPITPDDLLNFHELLRTEGWFPLLRPVGDDAARRPGTSFKFTK